MLLSQRRKVSPCLLKRFLLATDFALGALQAIDEAFRLSFALEALFGFLVPLLLGV